MVTGITISSLSKGESLKVALINKQLSASWNYWLQFSCPDFGFKPVSQIKTHLVSFHEDSKRCHVKAASSVWITARLTWAVCPPLQERWQYSSSCVLPPLYRSSSCGVGLARIRSGCSCWAGTGWRAWRFEARWPTSAAPTCRLYGRLASSCGGLRRTPSHCRGLWRGDEAEEETLKWPERESVHKGCSWESFHHWVICPSTSISICFIVYCHRRLRTTENIHFQCIKQFISWQWSNSFSEFSGLQMHSRTAQLSCNVFCLI